MTVSDSGWVLDLGLQDLIDEVMSIADSGYSRSRIGTIGDPAHQARTSAHNPEDSADADAPGNPDEQVDAVDIDHAPELGVDCARITETIRTRKEPRVKLVIWNGRQFSNYAHSGIPPYTWRPYSGTDQHTRHAHVEANDEHHDQRGPWGVATMIDDYVSNAIKYIDNRIRALIDGSDTVTGTATAPQGGGSPVWIVRTLKDVVARLVRIETAVGAAGTVTVELSEAQMEDIAQRVADKLGAVQFVRQGTAE